MVKISIIRVDFFSVTRSARMQRRRLYLKWNREQRRRNEQNMFYIQNRQSQLWHDNTKYKTHLKPSVDKICHILLSNVTSWFQLFNFLVVPFLERLDLSKEMKRWNFQLFLVDFSLDIVYSNDHLHRVLWERILLVPIYVLLD